MESVRTTVVVRRTADVSKREIITTVWSRFVAIRRCNSKESCRVHASYVMCLKKTRFERVWRNGVKARPLSRDRLSTLPLKQIKQTLTKCAKKLTDVDVRVCGFYLLSSTDVQTSRESFRNDETVRVNTRWLKDSSKTFSVHCTRTRDLCGVAKTILPDVWIAFESIDTFAFFALKTREYERKRCLDGHANGYGPRITRDRRYCFCQGVKFVTQGGWAKALKNCIPLELNCVSYMAE